MRIEEAADEKELLLRRCDGEGVVGFGDSVARLILALLAKPEIRELAYDPG